MQTYYQWLGTETRAADVSVFQLFECFEQSWSLWIFLNASLKLSVGGRKSRRMAGFKLWNFYFVCMCFVY